MSLQDQHNGGDNPPDVQGVVQSLAAPVFISAEPTPKFTFTVLDDQIHRTLYLDLTRPGASSVVPIICTAFHAGSEVKVWLVMGEPKDRVEWVQVPKPLTPMSA